MWAVQSESTIADVTPRPDTGVDAASIVSHLDEVIASPQFRDTTRMKRFLRYIVEEALAGRADRLKGYTIGLEVFDRPDSFDPQNDTIVRVQAGQLRRRLDLYYSQEGRDAPLRILVPRGGYAPIFEVRDSEPDKKPAAPSTGSGDGFASRTRSSGPPRPGIIVLTFSDLSLSSDRSFFAEGLTAEIVNALVQFRYLRVVTRTASVTSTGPSVGVMSLASKHDVEFVLTGSIRHAGENVRVSVNLIEAATGQHIYSKIFDRRYTPRNMFDIQDEIASYVAASVGAPYGAITRFHRQSMPDMATSAYEVILRYYEMNLAPSRTKAASLREDIETVIEENPNYSVAWAIRSLLDSFLVGQTLRSERAEQHVEAAIRAARKAVRLNSDNSLGYMALFLANFYACNIPEYRDAAARCVELNPNDAAALGYLAITRAFSGDMEDARELHERAVELLPRPPRWFSAVPGIDSLLAGHYQYVLSAVGRITPERGVWSQMLTLAALGHLNRPRVSEQLLDNLRDVHPNYDQELLACFQRWHPCDALAEVTVGGWKKAGLEV